MTNSYKVRNSVMPAKAGIQCFQVVLDASFRRHDVKGRFKTFTKPSSLTNKKTRHYENRCRPGQSCPSDHKPAPDSASFTQSFGSIFLCLLRESCHSILKSTWHFSDRTTLQRTVAARFLLPLTRKATP